MTNKPYKIIMSRGDDIQIDLDEIPDILKAIASKSPAIVRGGIVNTSFYVSIVKDKKRFAEFLEQIKYEDNRKELRIAGVPKLKPMFDKTVLKLQIKN